MKSEAGGESAKIRMRFIVLLDSERLMGSMGDVRVWVRARKSRDRKHITEDWRREG